MRTGAVRSFLLPAILGLLVAAALPVTAQDNPKVDDTYDIKIKVRYKTPNGSKPLAGAPVYLVHPDGSEETRCTNQKGVARFLELPAGDGYMLYSGPAFKKPKKKCTNWKFLNPDTNKKMYTVAWAEGKNPNGVRPSDTFSLPWTQTDARQDGGPQPPGPQELYEHYFLLRGKTPAKQYLVCLGLKATFVGTAGDDFFNGTPLENDVIIGRGGDDVLGGQCGNDVICGGSGNDRLFGDEDDDILFGQLGDDILEGGTGLDALNGGPGNDTCALDPDPNVFDVDTLCESWS